MFRQPNLQQGVERSTLTSIVATNRVLRNTYLLLALTLVFSAVTAGLAMASNAAPIGLLPLLIGFLGLPFLIQWLRNSAFALPLTFVFTGFVGWTLGPILNLYIAEFTNGSQLIMMALGGTGLIFVGLTAISLNPSRNFSHLGKFVAVGAVVAILGMLINVFFLHLPALQLMISVAFSLISGAVIMMQTNAIVNGGETNYVSATIMIYISLLNIFMMLLQVLGMFGGNRR